ncbi:unnamed protein product [Cuscuta epithymum]|uniref:Carbonic anhydrase n=1 Tax=Cuscuta epithymum TaxID=186058 RepID=A0AAV0FRJ3_9ASTE|nr:unnamed protein product [Cuscuta epithymum]
MYTFSTRKQMPFSSFLFTASLLMMICVFICQFDATQAQEVEDEREFDYDEKSEKGPGRWGELKKEWAACGDGKMQSPLALSAPIIKRRGGVRKPGVKITRNSYMPANATLHNRGHDISIEWVGDPGSIPINGKHFSLKAVHWHSPSEHTLHGTRYDLELHALHMNTDQTSGKNTTAVFSVLYRIGRKPNRFLSRLTKNIASMKDQKGEVRNAGFVDPNKIQFISNDYYRYTGSLTTPPCTEDVIWTVNKKIHNVSRKQVKLLREAVHDSAERNARPLQPRNNRDIYLRLSS